MFRKIADQFAVKIVEGRYNDANKMLDDSISNVWGAKSLKTAYEEMIEYFDGAKPEVITNWEEIGDVELDHGVMIYVPVESEAGGEAITVVINNKEKIIEVEFGRP